MASFDIIYFIAFGEAMILALQTSPIMRKGLQYVYDPIDPDMFETKKIALR